MKKWIVTLALTLASVAAVAQTNQGPFNTPQINSTYYVGSLTGGVAQFYPTIQSAVTAACAAGTNNVVDIPPAYTGSDPISGVTGGCTTTTLRDEHAGLPVTCYTWQSTVYSSSGVSCVAGTSGAEFPSTNGIVFNTSTTASRNATASDLATLGAVVSGAPSQTLTYSTNGQNTLTVANPNAGSSASSGFLASNGTDFFALEIAGTGTALPGAVTFAMSNATAPLSFTTIGGPILFNAPNTNTSGAFNWGSAAVSGNDYQVSPPGCISATVDGAIVNFNVSASNTGAATLSYCGGSSLPFVKNGLTALVSGDLVANGYYSATYDADNGVWHLMNSSLTGGGMVYPGAGVPDSTGSAWGTSYSVAGAGADLTSGPASSVSGDIATFTGTSGQLQDSGTLLSSLAPIASPTFTGTVTAPTFVGSLTGGASLDVPLGGGTMTGNLIIANPATATTTVFSAGNADSSLAVISDSDYTLLEAVNSFGTNVFIGAAGSIRPALLVKGAATFVQGIGFSTTSGFPNDTTTGFFQPNSSGGLTLSNTYLGTDATALSVIGTVSASTEIMTPLVQASTLYSAAGTALPTCAVGINGARAVVSDATAPTYMAAYTSGGTITAEAICSYNGSAYAWLTH